MKVGYSLLRNFDEAKRESLYGSVKKIIDMHEVVVKASLNMMLAKGV
jgi:hypothetical protein